MLLWNHSTIQERLIDIQSEGEARAIFSAHGWSNFWIKVQ